jgi:hypothetical protein
MKYLADGVVKAGKIAIADFVCPTVMTRLEFNPDYTVWMDTISRCKYENTNDMFEPPEKVDYHVSEWFDNSHQQLTQVINRYMGKHYEF